MDENRTYWKEEEEHLLKEWADKAQCYELLHSKSHAAYKKKHTYFVIPVIIISTITGTANFAQDKINEAYRNIFVMVTGGLNIAAAIITTIAQFLKISELNESHRVASYSWGKFFRNIKTELAKHPQDRMNPTDMLVQCKEEYDRLLEISPLVPKNIIKKFNNKFLDKNDIAKPEICDVIIPTNIYNISKEERLEMAKLYNPPKLEPIIETVEDTKIEQDKPEVDPMIEKFKHTFFQLNNRNPTDDEIRISLGHLFEKETEDTAVSDEDKGTSFV
jgi:hypothetical protein